MDVGEPLDLIVIGAGPVGLACGVEAARQGLTQVLVERGSLLNTLVRWPTFTVFFSTPELLEIGGIPFVCAGAKPTRREGLVYYRKVASHFGLNLRLYEEVTGLSREAGLFTVATTKATYRARKVVAATGFYDTPNLLGVPGEELPKVSHYYHEPFPYAGTEVLVVGGRNSAVEAALDLIRNGARVTMAVRRPTFGDSVKYWLRPDIENRVKEGSIRVLFETSVEEILPASVRLVRRGERTEIPNDFVLALTGYSPDFPFLSRLGIEVTEDGHLVYDHETMETTVPGLYVAGVVAAGIDIGKLFIENGRVHAVQIVRDILRKAHRSPEQPLAAPAIKRFQDGD
jgi:thioredoxin reductase (NADPH)